MARKPAPRAAATPRLDFQAATNDPFSSAIREDAIGSIQEIQAFFGAPYPDPVHFRLLAERADFDDAVKKFGLSPTQCWMVGMGVADRMVVLSPQAWKKQACEHDPADAAATRLLVKHELIHVYHGQFNPTRDFTGVDDLDWFVEGLAVYGSGQLSAGRIQRTQAAARAGQLPAGLQEVWTGADRYAFAGSLVAYVDRKWGRAAIVRLLPARSTAEALKTLGTDEPTLLAGWRSSLTP